MILRALRLPWSAADALHVLNLLVQTLLLWFCVVLVAPRVLMSARDQGQALPLFVATGIQAGAWLLRAWWVPVIALVAVAAWLAMRTPEALRPARLRLGLMWVDTLTTLLAAAMVVATILGLVTVWRS